MLTELERAWGKYYEDYVAGLNSEPGERCPYSRLARRAYNAWVAGYNDAHNIPY